MESSTSSQPNHLYPPVNRINLDMDFEQNIFSQDYNYSQDYSTGYGSGHGSAHGSDHGLAPVNDDVEDDSPVEEVSPVKPKKPSRHTARAKKDDPKEPPKDWTVAEEIALCQAWCDGRKKSKTSETTSGSASGGINLNDEADEDVEETQEVRLMGRDQSKAEKKLVVPFVGDLVHLVADKFLNMKKKWGKRFSCLCLSLESFAFSSWRSLCLVRSNLLLLDTFFCLWRQNGTLQLHEEVDDDLGEAKVVHLITLLDILVLYLINEIFPQKVVEVVVEMVVMEYHECDQEELLVTKKVEEKLVHLMMVVKFEVLIEKKNMCSFGLMRFDMWMEFLMVHLEELEMKKLL
ncbi:hypothetical protein Tco_0410225 [Tanacetum coccineum]